MSGSDFMLDPVTGEMVITNGDFVLVDGLDAIRQNLTQTLNFFYGEWFLDNTRGVPYFQEVLIKDPNLITIQGLFIDTISAVDGVDEILNFNFDYNNEARTLTVSFKASTLKGPINYSNTVQVK